ncbi:MAG TPA: stage 0 sporulation family protein [Chloroflexota bacterium]|nr:stage 0 sporulation family protein [Chloroflexota bacterium]
MAKVEDDSTRDFYAEARERFKQRIALSNKRSAMFAESGCGCDGCECALPQIEGAEVDLPELEVTGVRFRDSSRTYYFSPGSHVLAAGDRVVVETERGSDIGVVIIAPHQVAAATLEGELKPIVRVATEADLELAESLQGQQGEALKIFAEKVRDHKLPMKPVKAEYNHDGSRLTFYFSSNGRVDFRQLVRDLASWFRCRIELRQIGPREEARLIGSLGKCGRPLCCSTWLPQFADVTMTMARNQDISLNPMKNSGACGKLLCCLSYEDAFYREVRRALPRLGQNVSTEQGPGYVHALNLLRETVTVRLDAGEDVECSVADLTIGKGGRADSPQGRRQPRRDTAR